MSDVAKELAGYLAYAQMVLRAMPVDEDAQRRVDEMLRERSRGYVGRKLIRERKP